ncbi:hypothetical protein M4578_20385 [Salipiger sp. P9]|uniref:hypothetical protein n=1 Tax=Salipiger pentaromativorans TaxID=2943193 RepID=UPI0021574AAF|nr:hypothetical protein [Salipiger pentaromativorans]MCR8550185.1 hypothetical protein [Salipiger pentaromativorans]
MTAEITPIPTHAAAGDLLALTLRLGLLVVGAAMALSAFGLWLVPGASHLPELTLIKLGLSLFLLIGGLCCLTGASARRS